MFIAAPFNLGQGDGTETAFLLSHGFTCGTLAESNQDSGAGFKGLIGSETHAALAEVQHLRVMAFLDIEMAADH
jgi:hypothetical protein